MKQVYDYSEWLHFKSDIGLPIFAISLVYVTVFLVTAYITGSFTTWTLQAYVIFGIQFLLFMKYCVYDYYTYAKKGNRDGC